MLDRKIADTENKVNALYREIRGQEEVAQAFEMELINLRELRRLADLYHVTLTWPETGESYNDLIEEVIDLAVNDVAQLEEEAEIENSIRDTQVEIVQEYVDVLNKRDGLDKPSEEREPVHFFSCVEKATNKANYSKFDTYEDCHISINDRHPEDEWRVGEFKEVMPGQDSECVIGYANMYPTGTFGMLYDTIEETKSYAHGKSVVVIIREVLEVAEEDNIYANVHNDCT